MDVAGCACASTTAALDTGPSEGIGHSGREQMAQRRGECIRDVRTPRSELARDESAHHRLHLPLLRSPIPRDRLLDCRRRVFEDGHGRLPESGENHPAGMGELECGSRTHTVEGCFDRGGGRRVLLYYLQDRFME